MMRIDELRKRAVQRRAAADAATPERAKLLRLTAEQFDDEADMLERRVRHPERRPLFAGDIPQ